MPENITISREELTNLKARASKLEQEIIVRKQAEEELAELNEKLKLKLDAILSPDVEVGEQELSNIINSQEIQSMMDDFFTVTNMGMAIIDLKGNVLVGTGWQDICTKFHRVNPESLKNCLESDLVLTKDVPEGEIYFYKCKNNLWDIASPIYIGGKHVGNIFFGQFFFDDEEPDHDLFAAQAEKYGFGKDEYLAALGRVVRFSRDKVTSLMQFYVKFAGLVSKLSYSNLKLAKAIIDNQRVEAELRKAKEELEQKVAERTVELHQANKQLLTELEERKRAEEALRKAHTECALMVEERTRELAQRAAELESANKELSAFSYSASHVLRAPLRAINGFSRILRDEFTGKLDDEGRRMLKIVGENAVLMGQYIEDMLEFSNTGRREVKASVLDMKEVVKDAIEELKPLPEKRDIKLEIAELPQAVGDRTMIRQAFRNLIANAFKFTKPRETAQIEVGGISAETEEIYFVRDNGVGFNMQYKDKLFGVFQRLHGEDEFGGTGIGLAIVKRIAEKHGGRVWAEGKVNEGATFYFTLPRRQVAAVPEGKERKDGDE